ncbi:hypothetical protein RDABS01_006796, partial [Bienertia sinuspersici]
MHKFTSLQHLKTIRCPKVHCNPKGGLPRNLEKLAIEAVLNQAIQEWELYRLHSLELLTLSEVNSKEDLSLPSSLSRIDIGGNVSWILTSLYISDGVNIDRLIREWGLHLLTILEHLQLHNVGSCIDIVEHIPGPDLDLPSSLLSLTIEGFQNLKSLTCFSTLPNLFKFIVECCPKFESFADNVIPPQLISLIAVSTSEILSHPIVLNISITNVTGALVAFSLTKA